MPEYEPISYRDIANFPGYRVGDDGSVWSCRKRVGFGKGGGTYVILADYWWRLIPSLSRGHEFVNLCPGLNQRYVHRLILEAFVGPCPGGMECCHNDGNPRNNHLHNLRWDTHLANVADTIKHETKPFGERIGTAVLTEELVRSIRAANKATGHGCKKLAKRFGINHSTISSVLSGRNWGHVV